MTGIQDAVCRLAPLESILGGVVTKKHEALVTLTTIGKTERWCIDFLYTTPISFPQSLDLVIYLSDEVFSQGWAEPGAGLPKLLLDNVVQMGS